MRCGAESPGHRPAHLSSSKDCHPHDDLPNGISKLTVSFRTDSGNLNSVAVRAIPTKKRQAGGSRSERARSRILRAAAALLTTQGPRRMSIEGVADKAGVSKATIYRWWESKGELALDALVVELVARLRSVPDTGSIRED